ncbi:MAG: tetratricopeptide repeat protein [Ignavibacteria bacterium]|nr:tetratricopeptide repeat protein [Ignavibacteria bacterium]
MTENKKEIALTGENYYTQSRKYYENNDFESSINYVNLALEIFKSEDIPEMIFECLLLRASNYSGKLDFKKSLQDLNECEDYCKKFGLNNGLMRTYNLIGYNYSYLNQFDNATKAFENSLNIARTIFDDKFMITLSLNLLTIYTLHHSFDKSAKLILECSKLFKSSKNKFKYAVFLEKISLLFSEINEFEKANEINNYLLYYYESENNKYKKGIISFYLGNNYYKENKFDVALGYYKESLSAILDSDYTYNLYEIYLNLGITLFKLEKSEEALEYFNKFLDSNTSENKEFALVCSYLGEYYFLKNDTGKSKNYFLKSINLFHDLSVNSYYTEVIIKYVKCFKNILTKEEILEYMNEAMKLCEKSADYKVMLLICKELSDYYGEIGETENSNFYKNKTNYLNLLKKKNEEKFELKKSELKETIKNLNLKLL